MAYSDAATRFADKFWDEYYSVLEEELDVGNDDAIGQGPPLAEALFDALLRYDEPRANYTAYGLPEDFDDSEEHWAAYNASPEGIEFLAEFRAAAAAVVAAAEPWLRERWAKAAAARRSYAVLACAEAHTCHCPECEPPRPAAVKQLHVWSF